MLRPLCLKIHEPLEPGCWSLKKAVFLPLHCILEAEGRSSDRPTHADGRAALAVGPPELPAAPTQRRRVIRQRFSTFSAAVAAGFSC